MKSKRAKFQELVLHKLSKIKLNYEKIEVIEAWLDYVQYVEKESYKEEVLIEELHRCRSIEENLYRR